MQPGLLGGLTPDEQRGLLEPYRRPEPGPLAGILGPPLSERLQEAHAAQRARWDAGDRLPTPMDEDNMWLADDVAGGILGPMAFALGAGPGMADKIAKMLRQGRAAEVTDDMLGALGPNGNRRLYELYESGATGMDLPMDEASRMARAREMGFGPGFYSSTLDDTRAFNPTGDFMGYTGTSGASLTDSPEAASRYLDRYGEIDYKGEPFKKNVMPLAANLGNAETRSAPYPTKLRLGAPLPEGYVPAHAARDYDTAIFEDAVSRRGPVKHSDAKNAIRSREYVIANPANIRSRHARFDPRLTHNADLLASMAGAGFLGSMALPRGEDR